MYRVNLAKAVGYLLKGANKQTANVTALFLREPGVPVLGKRCGCSENVGAAAEMVKGYLAAAGLK